MTRSTERVAVALLLAITGLALAIRVLAIAEPLGIDQSLWASAARGMARGQLLYRDLWEQRPPGIYFTYLAAFSVFGWREATVTWLDVIASAATAALIFDIVRLLGGRLAGAVAAASYAVLTMRAALYGNGGFLERSVCETFTVAWVALGASAAARVHRGARQTYLLFGLVGLATGMAVIYKPNAGLYLPALTIWLWCYWRPTSHVTSRWPPFVVMWGAAALPTAGVIVWLLALDLVADARVAVVDFNRFYVTAGVTLDAMARAFAEAVFLRMKTNALWAAGSIGGLWALVRFVRDRRLDPLPALAVAWGAAAAGVIFVNGIRLFPAYFINPLPPLAVMTAWLIVGGQTAPRRRRGGVGLLVTAAMVALMMMRGYGPRVLDAARADFDVLAGRVERAEYLERFGGYANNRGYSARANDELAAYIAARTTVDDRVFLFGVNGTALYFLADRLIAHRFLRVNFFVPEVFPHPAFTRAAVVTELERAAPRYVIFERVHGTSEVNRQIDALPVHPAVAPWLEARYVRETVIEDFTIYRRR